jgi:fatty-acyl-CoA synthase
VSARYDLGGLNEAIAAAIPDREAIVFRGRRLTWRQVAERTRRLANHLAGRGLGCRHERSGLENWQSGQDHLAIYLHNGNEYLEAMLGSYKARVAPFNVNYRYVEDELLYLLNDADARAIVYHARFAPTLAQIRPKLAKLEVLLQVADDSGEALLPGAVDYESALAQSSPEPPAVEPSPDDLYILYTGGTTGMPKGVLWRQEDIFFGALGGRPPGMPMIGSVEELVERANYGSLRALAAPPFMHGAAHWMAFNCMHQGGTIVVQDRPDRLDPDDVWSTVEREKVGFLTIVGDAFGRPLLDQLRRQHYDLSSFHALLSGGAILTSALKTEFLERIPHLMVIDGFGASETGGHGTNLSTAGASVSTGKFTMTDTVVLEEDLSALLPVESRETGLLARAGFVPLGYYKDPEKTRRTFPVIGGKRYAAPGDHARYADDGSILVLGRGSVSINSGGEKIYPEEVEQALKHHPSVWDAVVVGTPSERWGEQVTALVQLRAGAKQSTGELADFCATKIARYKVPKAILFVPEVVRSPSGKADYRWAKSEALRRLAA